MTELEDLDGLTDDQKQLLADDDSAGLYAMGEYVLALATESPLAEFDDGDPRPSRCTTREAQDAARIRSILDGR